VLYARFVKGGKRSFDLRGYDERCSPAEQVLDRKEPLSSLSICEMGWA
jgi:hypothetical protein